MIDFTASREKLALEAQKALNDAVDTIDDLTPAEFETVVNMVNREIVNEDPLIRMLGGFAALGLRLANEASYLKGNK